MLFSAPPHSLDKLAIKLRLSLLDLIKESGGGHIGGSLSSLDILAALYLTDVFNFKKDHFILSAGHHCTALYTVLSHAGYFPKDWLGSYSSFGSRLQGHVSLETPGVEYASGSLGQGLSFATGTALGDRDNFTITLTTDGEHQEGQVWEALQFANKYHLGNLVNIVDANRFQIDGPVEEIMPLGDVAAKYIRFGWSVTTVDGHDYHQIIKALNKAKNASIYPTCIIARTVIGKGISFMENDYHYHTADNLADNLYQKAKRELEAKL